MHEIELLCSFVGIRLGTVKVWDRGVGKDRRGTIQE